MSEDTLANTSQKTTKFSPKVERDKSGRFLKGSLSGDAARKYYGPTLPVESGQMFGAWRILSPEALRRNGRLFVLALCTVCGKELEADFRNLVKGFSTRCGSCGIKKSRATRDAPVWGRAIDSMDVVLTERWDAMMRRCYDPSCQGFARYGGRGIKVHPSLHNKVDYANYVRSLPKASTELEIDRIDNNGDYAPGNLRWVTRKENTRNTEFTVWLFYKGERMSSKEFAEKYVSKFRPQTVARLAKRGFTGEEILERESRCTRAGLRYRKRGTEA